MENRKRNAVILLLTLIAIVIINLPVTTNFWMLITQKNFDIPKESSFWAFRPDRVNNVRDDWWFYGHDSKSYFFKDKDGFKSISKEQAKLCSGFVKTDIETWCQ